MADQLTDQTNNQQSAGSRATYRVDPAHTTVEFAARHMMFATVKGRFGAVQGEIVYDEAAPTRSSVVASAEVASVDTRESNRDAHLRSADFFDAERFPKITFQSRRVEPLGEGQYRVVGDLTIRGVTHEVAFEGAYLGKGIDPWGGTRVGFSATATLNRKDFGLNWNVALEAGGWLVGDQVKLSLEVEAVRES